MNIYCDKLVEPDFYAKAVIYYRDILGQFRISRLNSCCCGSGKSPMSPSGTPAPRARLQLQQTSASVVAVTAYTQ